MTMLSDFECCNIFNLQFTHPLAVTALENFCTKDLKRFKFVFSNLLLQNLSQNVKSWHWKIKTSKIIIIKKRKRKPKTSNVSQGLRRRRPKNLTWCWVEDVNLCRSLNGAGKSLRNNSCSLIFDSVHSPGCHCAALEMRRHRWGRDGWGWGGRRGACWQDRACCTIFNVASGTNVICQILFVKYYLSNIICQITL